MEETERLKCPQCEKVFVFASDAEEEWEKHWVPEEGLCASCSEYNATHCRYCGKAPSEGNARYTGDGWYATWTECKDCGDEVHGAEEMDRWVTRWLAGGRSGFWD
jgi:hypothetical protein